MNIEANIAKALEMLFDKAQEVSEKQFNESIKDKVKGWEKQLENINLITDIQEANKSMTKLYNEMLPVVDQWERGNFNQQ